MYTETTEHEEYETWEDVPQESKNYQHKFFEICIEPGKLRGQYIPDFPEQIKEKRDLLSKRLHELAKEKLTERQYSIFRLTCDGYTQVQIGELLGIKQSTVHKAIRGNYIVARDYPRPYGGLIRRLKKAILKDTYFMSVSNELLMELEEWREVVGLNPRSW